MSGHETRAHSKFSASGSERWLNCAASVELEEASPPSADNPWSIEGTKAHEVLEILFKMHLNDAFKFLIMEVEKSGGIHQMIIHAKTMIDYVLEIKEGLQDPELLIEERVHNNEIHPEMFGKVDTALVETFGTLHVFDYKYGQGHVVNPVKNTQMIQYGLGLLEKYDWAFDKVVLHICQPRAGGTGHKSWEVSIDEMKTYRELWRKGVARVEKGKNKPMPGSWCHWCRAKQTCPAKQSARAEKTFGQNPFTERTEDGIKEKDGKEKSRSQKSAEEKELERYYKRKAKKENAFEDSFF